MESNHLIVTLKQLSINSPSNVEIQTKEKTISASVSWQNPQENCNRLNLSAPESIQQQSTTHNNDAASFTVTITSTPHSAGSFPIEMRKRRKQTLERITPYFGLMEQVKARKSLVF